MQKESLTFGIVFVVHELKHNLNFFMEFGHEPTRLNFYLVIKIKI